MKLIWVGSLILYNNPIGDVSTLIKIILNKNKLNMKISGIKNKKCLIIIGY
jgi:hypothetical protein